MPTLPNMSLITPTLGGDSGTWDDKINACFVLIDSHDHTPGKGVKVPVAGLNINDNISLAGSYALQNIYSLDFSAVSAPNTGTKRLFVSSSDNELYWRTNSGSNVKLTLGTSINTTLVGGIVGDYSSVGAEVAFDDANKRYTFKDQSSPSKKWARLASGPVRIYEYNTTESVYVEHAVDAALAASYTVTWPAALPASTLPLQISAAGVVSTPDSITLPTNGNITLSGTGTNGYVKHGTYTLCQQLFVHYTSSGSDTAVGTTGGGAFSFARMSASSTVYYQLTPLGKNKRLKTVVLPTVEYESGVGSITYDVMKWDNSGGTLVSVLSAPVSSAATTNVTMTASGSGYSMVGTEAMWLKVTVPAATTIALFTAQQTYDHP